jgi:Glycosyl hydrolase family 57
LERGIATFGVRTGGFRGEVTVASPLNTFALFHLNLAFSSIEEEERALVVANCYEPLLELAERHGPIAIEATAYTLKAVQACNPAWLNRLKTLIGARKIEFVGSGYAQVIGPLLPAQVVAANLRLGNQAYQDLLGLTPKVALVNEQAYSSGLVGHYLDAGYEALLVDWDNVANSHPDWQHDFRYAPQRAIGNDGRDIAILWTNTVAFQKLQRLAHDDISREAYVEFVAAHRHKTPRVLCLYASDGEVFGFRPGRYRSENANHGAAEWQRIDKAFEALSQIEGLNMVSPSQALEIKTGEVGNNQLRLESPAYPVPVKKQRKYNLTRWAVTGRDDIGVNAACQRIYEFLKQHEGSDDDWRELCRLWASDFRTHITKKRWDGFCRDLEAIETRLKTYSPASLLRPTGKSFTDRYLDIETACVRARLDRRRGLAIVHAAFAPDFVTVVGTLPHGTFDDIALQADWYTGDCVFEAPGEPKVTDLDWADTQVSQLCDGSAVVRGEIATPLGPIVKIMTFQAGVPRIDFDLQLGWDSFGRGALRLGHVTLVGEGFDQTSLKYVTHNGGVLPERFELAGHTVEHGAPVSFLVSASCAVGMTEGWLELGDDVHTVRVEVDRKVAPLIGLINHRSVGGKLFCQLMLSALELDDTRKPTPYHKGPRRFGFSIVGKTV